MRIAVTGASGFLGKAVVSACANVGHTVRGLVRSPVKFQEVRAAGGEPILADVTDAPALEAAIEGVEVVIHLAQSASESLDERRRVRVGGADALLAAGLRTGLHRLIVGSGYWVYASSDGVITEESPLRPLWISQVNYETEQVARSAMRRGQVECTIVRPGMVYGAGSWFLEMVKELRAGTYRYVDEGHYYLSPVFLSDAAEAFRLLCERWSPGETFVVVDDEPVMESEFGRFVADLLGVPTPTSIGAGEAAKAWGNDTVALSTASRRASNAKLRARGWSPRYRSFRSGVPPVLESIPKN